MGVSQCLQGRGIAEHRWCEGRKEDNGVKDLNGVAEQGRGEGGRAMNNNKGHRKVTRKPIILC